MRPRPSWQKKRKLGHPVPRGDHRTPPQHRKNSTHKLILCLWSAGGDEVTRIDAYGAPGSAPPFCVHGRLRYDQHGAPTKTAFAHIVHYRTTTVVRRVRVLS